MAELIRVNTNITKEINEWLSDRSEKTGISKSTLIHLALEQYRNQHEVVSEMPKLLALMEVVGQMDLSKLMSVEK